MGELFPGRGKRRTPKNKVVFVPHGQTTHVTMTLKAGHAGPASHIYREVMNPKAKSEESPNLASIERESKQLKTLGLSRPSKPSNIGTQLGVPRSQTRGKRDLILWEHVDAPNKCAEGTDINRVWLSTVHKVGGYPMRRRAVIKEPAQDGERVVTP